MTTTKLGLTETANGQANYLNVNATFAQLNQIVQALVVDKDLSAPPGSPANEALYIVGSSPTGLWSGKAGQLAYWLTTPGNWTFIVPREGMLVYLADEDTYYSYSGSAWAVFAGGGASLPAGRSEACTYGGTANAITLTPTYGATAVSYADKDVYRFRATSSNTGATTINVNGLGAKAAVTVTGVALPAGYIRTDVETTITFDAAADSFVVGREIERGSNAGGSFTRLADGSLTCTQTLIGAITMGASGLAGLSRGNVSWTFPAAFNGSPSFSGSGVDNSNIGWVSRSSISATAITIVYFSSTATVTSSSIAPVALGYWY
ncbi:DUF2793 domain-containing protein [Pseudomonas segetis]